MTDLPSADDLLELVHETINAGVDITTSLDGYVEVRWRRDNDGRLSDERYITGENLLDALQAVLDYEAQMDEEEADDY